MSRLRLTVATAAAVGLVAALVPAGSAIADPTPSPTSSFTATPLTPTDVVVGAKSLTGRLAESDEALLKATSPAPVNVVVKLDYDSARRLQGWGQRVRGHEPERHRKESRPRQRRGREVRQAHRGHREQVPGRAAR